MSLTWDELTLSADAYSSGSAYATPSPCTRVYRCRGRYAHYREATGCPAVMRGRDDDWLGAGTQHEYEQAAAMPLCPACFAWRHPAGDWDPRLGSAHGTEMT